MRTLVLLVVLTVLGACGSGPEVYEAEPASHPKVNKPVDFPPRCANATCDGQTAEAY